MIAVTGEMSLTLHWKGNMVEQKLLRSSCCGFEVVRSGEGGRGRFVLNLRLDLG